MRELLAELTHALDNGRDCVWCAVVETRGSTPQKAGAAMLVFADGSQIGTLGGGCIEAEVKQRALAVLDGYAAEHQRLIDAGRGCVEAVLLAEGHDAPPGSRFLFDSEGRYVAA